MMKRNKIERLKLQKRPIDYYPYLFKLQPDSIDEADRFYLKNFGIYNNKLRPDEWMVRIRIPGGRIAKEQLQAIKTIAHELEAQTILTARAQIELHRLTLQQAIEAHRRLTAEGITTFATLTDNVRNILTDPFDGLLEDSYYEVYGLIEAMERRALDPELLGLLPRKFNVAITGNRVSKISFFSQDLFFAPAKLEDRFGFRVYLGGKNTHLAQESDLFLTPQEVVPFYEKLLEAYSVFGARDSRTRARLYHLLQSDPTFLDRVIERLPFAVRRGGKVLLDRYEGKVRLKGGLGFETYGRYGLIDLERIDLERYTFFRIGADQKLYAFTHGVTPEDEDFLTVCAGSRYCVFSLFDTKEEIAKILTDLVGTRKLRIALSGCLKGCARHILADIGFVGIRTNQFGTIERGVRLYLGGEYTHGTKAARLIYWAVPLRSLASLLQVIIDDFRASELKNFEDYSKRVLNRFSTDYLAYYFLAKSLTKRSVSLRKISSEAADPFGLRDGDLHETIKRLEYRLFGAHG